MVRTLCTIIEVDAVEKDVICIKGKCAMKSACEDFNTLLGTSNLKQMIDCFPYPCQSESRLELCEPESELDPSTETPEVLTSDAAQESKKSRRKRRVSLIDKALKGQQCQQVDPLPDAQPQVSPVYIRLSDLSSDWSRYIAKSVTGLSREPTSVNIPIKDADTQSTEQLQAPAANQVLPKRNNRKKSLIDKAASRQNREMYLAQLQEVEQTKSSSQTFCSLCKDRMNRTPCSLCSRQS
jgi:hypothetical protein